MTEPSSSGATGGAPPHGGAPVWVEVGPSTGAAAHAADGPGIPKLVGQVLDDVKEVVRTEIGLYRAKATERITAYKGAAIMFGAAAVLALEGLCALLVGLILTIGSHIGYGWATLIVIGVTFAVAGALAFVGVKRLAPAPAAGAAK